MEIAAVFGVYHCAAVWYNRTDSADREYDIETEPIVPAADKGQVSAVDQGLYIRVMTYNIRHGRGLDGKINLNRIAEDIIRSGAEIVALQEVDRFNIRSGFQDQVRVLAEKTGMNWSFATSLRWGFAQYGNATLSKYPILSKTVYTLPGIKETRTLLKTVIQYGDIPLTVLNTHLGVGLEERKEQIPVLAELLNETEGPAILMGDFNMESDHFLLKRLLDQWEKVKLNVKSPTVLSGLEIDHIYVNRPALLQNAWTMISDASDHNPVVAEWQWAFGSRMVMAASDC